MNHWNSQARERAVRLEAARGYAHGKYVDPGHATALLQALLRPRDRLCLEGDNQKQADFRARALVQVDPQSCMTCMSCNPAWSCRNTWNCSKRASPAGWTSAIPDRKAAPSPAPWKKGASRSAPSTPTGTASPATSST